ncbi:MAG: PEP-CTERM sorting domain-containing protein [Phycisphaeraceae bacterium]|nr:PEP-CTERM sorting domain-containing protein [Phycisphaeraceae bacterium]
MEKRVIRCRLARWAVGVGFGLALAGPAWAVPYTADKIVPLPPPNPQYTNIDSGTIIFGPGQEEYIVEVENNLRLDHWKEWMIIYTITPLTPDNWLADLHVDYSKIVDPGPPEPWFDLLLEGSQYAFWQTYYGGSSSPVPLSWTVVGYPFTVNPISVDPQQADLVIDTMPFWWNPEWVSLEFSGANVQIDYTFIDWCVPEPSALGVLALAGLGVLRRRR